MASVLWLAGKHGEEIRKQTGEVRKKNYFISLISI